GLGLLHHRHDGGRRRVDVRPDDVFDLVVIRETLGARDGDLGIIPVVDAGDLDAVLLPADGPAALLVDQLRRCLRAVPVHETPRSGRAAHHAEHADLEDLLLGVHRTIGHGQRNRAGDHDEHYRPQYLHRRCPSSPVLLEPAPPAPSGSRLILASPGFHSWRPAPFHSTLEAHTTNSSRGKFVITSQPARPTTTVSLMMIP